MINFLRIVNNIKAGDYLHLNGTIDDRVSSDIIGLCVIPSNFLPDKYARIMSLRYTESRWDLFGSLRQRQQPDYKVYVPLENPTEKSSYGFILTGRSPRVISPCLPNQSFNPNSMIDLEGGNAFQDFKGYENTRHYKEEIGDLKGTAFLTCSNLAPDYKKTEWYLPALGELACLIAKKGLIYNNYRAAIRAGAGYAGPGKHVPDKDFWSSTEKYSESAWFLGMSDGYVNDLNKQDSRCVIPFLTL